MWIKLLDTFPGESKGKTKNVEDYVARQLIAIKQAEAVDAPKAEAKSDEEATKRQVKTDKTADKASDK